MADIEYGSLYLNMYATLTLSTPVLNRSQVWWDDRFPYRRPITIVAPPTGLEEGHPVKLVLSSDLVTRGKIEADLDDIQIAQITDYAPERWRVLSRKAEATTEGIIVTFDLKEAIEPDEISEREYFIHYGFKATTGMPRTKDYVDNPYPVLVEPDDAGISYTRPDNHWADGVSGISQAKATFVFYGDQVRLYSDKGPNAGIAEIQIDDEDWVMVDTYASAAAADQIIFERTGLDNMKHTLRVRVSGEKNSSSTSNTINIKKITYRKYVVVTNTKEELDPRMMWTSVFGGVTNG
jgi:hypothetical protein